ncbi:fumarylacetoacetate hydrolase family protein [Sphingosinicella terrae]|uniref:fumarylacetoacetate hydrolase family protein n=1 Tax=Sphingosinicella terrae TaxID=2172047 RepID=UPI000E0DF715|nr:fumarylacetoacetate hydrolase family protein [Sphingosinicella terrae]
MSDIYALGTFSEGAGGHWPGVIRGGRVAALAKLIPVAPADLLSVFRQWEVWGARIDAAVASAQEGWWRPEGELVAHLPCMPDNLFGAGANYRKHVIELIVDSGAGGTGHLSPEERRAYGEREMDQRAASGKPFVWVAARSSIAGPERALVLPHDIQQPDWELELAVLIGRRARRVPAARALDHVAGYMIANDITARELVTRSDLKNLGMDWMACKGSPGFKILGPYVTPARFVADPQKLHIRLSLNGEVMQDEGTDDMIFGVAQIIEFVSAHCELQPGDVIMTGSPSGNGTHYGRFLRDGDEMRGEIDGLVGAQVVRCVGEPVGSGKAFEAA